MNIGTKIAIAKALKMLRMEGMLVDFKYNCDSEIPFFIPAQPIPDIPNWREWCGKLQECGVMFEFDWGTGRESDWRVADCLFCMAEINDYRIPEQPVPATIANYLNEEKTMVKSATTSIEVKLPVVKVSEDVMSVLIVCHGDLQKEVSKNIDWRHNAVAPAEIHLDRIGNSATWGVTYKWFVSGDNLTEEEFNQVNQRSEILFSNDGTIVGEHRKKGRYKFEEIQLPSMRVSEDVTNVYIQCRDRLGQTHNFDGEAITAYTKDETTPEGWAVDRRYFVKDRYMNENEFKHASRPPKEMTAEDAESALNLFFGCRVKIVGKTE